VYYQGDWQGGRAGKAILRIPYDGSGDPELVTLQTGAYIDISADGSRLLFGGSVFPISVAPLNVLPIPDESVFETSLVGDSPRFSPDGSKLLYQHNEASPQDKFKYIIADTGTWEVILVGPKGSTFIGSASWINDNEFIYHGDDGGIWLSDGIDSELIFQSKSFGIDANPATQMYLDSGQSGSPDIAIRAL